MPSGHKKITRPIPRIDRRRESRQASGNIARPEHNKRIRLEVAQFQRFHDAPPERFW